MFRSQFVPVWVLLLCCCWIRIADSLATSNNRNPHCCVVVGKIIIDEYKPPNSSNDNAAAINIGGGGPQAAWGAAAALAVLQEREIDRNSSVSLHTRPDVPPRQPVAFVGPVGKISDSERSSLHSVLDPVAFVSLVEDTNFENPRIRLWHDEAEDMKWFPLQDSWGISGADGLWRNRPNAVDVLEAARALAAVESGENVPNNRKVTLDSLFLIMEAGRDAPGGGEDSLLLEDKLLRQQTRVIGLEPVAFPDDTTGLVALEDSNCFQNRLKNHECVDVLVPDKFLFEAINPEFWKNYDVAARYGHEGSVLCDKNTGHKVQIPVSTLRTPTGGVVNPTGAGNAFSAALTACLGTGLSLLDAACVGTAVGAAVCEHQHLPPWSWESIDRICAGVDEVKSKLRHDTIQHTVD